MTTYTNESVVSRIAHAEGVSREEAERYFQGALQFLALAASSEENLAPSPKVDAACHAFILHTADYMDYCREYLGRYVHHQPLPGGEEGDHDRYASTLALAQDRFGGDLDATVWVEPGMWKCQSGGDGSCGCWEGPARGEKK